MTRSLKSVSFWCPLETVSILDEAGDDYGYKIFGTWSNALVEIFTDSAFMDEIRDPKVFYDVLFEIEEIL